MKRIVEISFDGLVRQIDLDDQESPLFVSFPATTFTVIYTTQLLVISSDLTQRQEYFIGTSNFVKPLRIQLIRDKRSEDWAKRINDGARVLEELERSASESEEGEVKKEDKDD